MDRVANLLATMYKSYVLQARKIQRDRSQKAAIVKLQYLQQFTTSTLTPEVYTSRMHRYIGMTNM